MMYVDGSPWWLDRRIGPPRRKRARSRAEPTYTVSLDLRGILWAGDRIAATSLLGQQPGVVDLRPDLRRKRAVVRHGATTSLPQLWNWLARQRTTGSGSAGG